MVELAKEAGLPVCAANAPRRHVSAIGRSGEAEFTRAWKLLPSISRAFADLPPLPLPAPSRAYMAQ